MSLQNAECIRKAQWPCYFVRIRLFWARALAGLETSFTFRFLHGKDRSSRLGVISHLSRFIQESPVYRTNPVIGRSLGISLRWTTLFRIKTVNLELSRIVARFGWHLCRVLVVGHGAPLSVPLPDAGGPSVWRGNCRWNCKITEIRGTL